MHYLLQLLVIFGLVALGTVKTTIQGRICKKHLKNTQDTLLYNAQVFAFISLVMVVLFGVSVPDATLILFAVICAVANLLFQCTYSAALSAGPVSLTVLIINFNVLVTTGVRIVFFGEKLYLTQIAGIILLLVSFVLSTAKSENDKKGSIKWLVLTVTASLSTAVGAVLQKIYGKMPTEVENSDTTFFFFLYFIACLIGLAIIAVRRYTVNEKITSGLAGHILLPTLVIGVVLGVYQKLNMFAMVNIDGAVLFPTYAGLASLAMTLIGVAMFKDTLSKKQIVGVACGVACIVLMNIRVGVHF